MADEFLRVGGRHYESEEAKGLRTDENGRLESKIKASEYRVMDGTQVIAPGQTFNWTLPEPFTGKTTVWVSQMSDAYTISYMARQSASAAVYAVEIANSGSHSGQRKYNFPESELPTLPTAFGANTNRIVVTNNGTDNISPIILIISSPNNITAKDMAITNFPTVQKVENNAYKSEVYQETFAKIIDVIGEENIALFLPMKRDTDGKFRDLLRKEITFSLNGSGTVVDGPLGSSININTGNRVYLSEDAVISSVSNGGSTTDNKISDGSQKLAVKIVGNGSRVKRVKFGIKKIGSPVARIRAFIYSDNSGVPGVPVHSIDYIPIFSTKQSMRTSYLNTTNTDIGLALDAPVDLDPTQTYWLVLEYEDVTTINADNCVIWTGNTTSAGNTIANYNGTSWTTTENKNLFFELYTADLDIEGRESSFIVAAKSTTKSGILLSTREKNALSEDARDYTLGLRNGVFVFGVSSVPYNTSLDGYREHAVYGKASNEWQSFAMTVSGEWSLERANGYVNGAKVATAQATQLDGLRGMQLPVRTEPWIIGAEKNPSGSFANNGWVGNIGAFIIAKRQLTDMEIGKIHKLLFVSRTMGGRE